MKTILLSAAAVLCLVGGVVSAGSPRIYAEDGTFLGNLNDNQLDPDSVANPLGRYGSPLSPDSINNPLGRYGSPLSPDSVNNPLGRGSYISSW
jgi:hypothetical protein